MQNPPPYLSDWTPAHQQSLSASYNSSDEDFEEIVRMREQLNQNNKTSSNLGSSSSSRLTATRENSSGPSRSGNALNAHVSAERAEPHGPNFEGFAIPYEPSSSLYGLPGFNFSDVSYSESQGERQAPAAMEPRRPTALAPPLAQTGKQSSESDDEFFRLYAETTRHRNRKSPSSGDTIHEDAAHAHSVARSPVRNSRPSPLAAKTSFYHPSGSTHYYEVSSPASPEVCEPFGKKSVTFPKSSSESVSNLHSSDYVDVEIEIPLSATDGPQREMKRRGSPKRSPDNSVSSAPAAARVSHPSTLRNPSFAFGRSRSVMSSESTPQLKIFAPEELLDRKGDAGRALRDDRNALRRCTRMPTTAPGTPEDVRAVGSSLGARGGGDSQNNSVRHRRYASVSAMQDILQELDISDQEEGSDNHPFGDFSSTSFERSPSYEGGVRIARAPIGTTPEPVYLRRRAPLAASDLSRSPVSRTIERAGGASGDSGSNLSEESIALGRMPPKSPRVTPRQAPPIELARPKHTQSSGNIPLDSDRIKISRTNSENLAAKTLMTWKRSAGKHPDAVRDSPGGAVGSPGSSSSSPSATSPSLQRPRKSKTSDSSELSASTRAAHYLIQTNASPQGPSGGLVSQVGSGGSAGGPLFHNSTLLRKIPAQPKQLGPGIVRLGSGIPLGSGGLSGPAGQVGPSSSGGPGGSGMNSGSGHNFGSGTVLNSMEQLQMWQRKGGAVGGGSAAGSERALNLESGGTAIAEFRSTNFLRGLGEGLSNKGRSQGGGVGHSPPSAVVATGKGLRHKRTTSLVSGLFK